VGGRGMDGMFKGEIFLIERIVLNPSSKGVLRTYPPKGGNCEWTINNY
jgi:hypothetical protein